MRIVTCSRNGKRFVGHLDGEKVQPLGAPEEGDDTANGVVVCEGSDHEVAGFQASWTGDEWDVALVPDLGHDQYAGCQRETPGEGDLTPPALQPSVQSQCEFLPRLSHQVRPTSPWILSPALLRRRSGDR